MDVGVDGEGSRLLSLYLSNRASLPQCLSPADVQPQDDFQFLTGYSESSTTSASELWGENRASWNPQQPVLGGGERGWAFVRLRILGQRSLT